ncbi:g-protein alpha subunit [Dictyocaulus viviparus]|uniref:G-protein alpha subunit n=1 Tax=Dictyocaulus viviparus TaxID=29172 RepID=A0A0D8XF89_DICVI|nr:g-protein alpha subunit [Dictyocaulus viviparus]
MVLCCTGRSDEQTRMIERELHNERKILRRQIKILLLGSGESGKSTFIKQMNIIHGAGEFTADESDSCQYFFDHLDRIAMPNFHPTNKDILYCRKATRGICEHTFEINKIPFRFIDVGGQRSQRQKWFQCFTDITSILFMVASNEYDQLAVQENIRILLGPTSHFMFILRRLPSY